MAKPPPPQRPPPPGSLFGQGGSYLGEDEPQDVTQSGLGEEKTQAHIVSQPPLISPAPLLPGTDVDFNEKTFKRQGPPPVPKRLPIPDYEEKTLKRQGPAPATPFFTPADLDAFGGPAPSTAAAPELPPEAPTRQLDQQGFQKLADDVRDVLPELATGSEEATAVHPLPALPEPPPDLLPEPGPEGPTGVIDPSVLKRQAAALDEEAAAYQASDSLELTPELPESAEPAPELPESPPEDKTTMQPFPERPGLAQRARALWSKVQPGAVAAWQRARRRPALLAAGGVGAVVAIALAAFLLSGESAAELEARTVQLRTATDGTIARVVLGKNGRVKKGDLLLVVTLDRPVDASELAPLEKNLQVAQAALQRARSGAELKKIAAEIARKKAGVASAKRDEIVVAARVKKKKATVEQLALATVKVHNAEERLQKATDRQAELAAKAPAELAQAQGEVDAAQSALDIARTKESLVEIRSPVDGVVVTPEPARILGKRVHRGEPVLAVLSDER